MMTGSADDLFNEVPRCCVCCGCVCMCDLDGGRGRGQSLHTSVSGDLIYIA